MHYLTRSPDIPSVLRQSLLQLFSFNVCISRFRRRFRVFLYRIVSTGARCERACVADVASSVVCLYSSLFTINGSMKLTQKRERKICLMVCVCRRAKDRQVLPPSESEIRKSNRTELTTQHDSVTTTQT